MADDDYPERDALRCADCYILHLILLHITSDAATVADKADIGGFMFSGQKSEN